MPRTRVEPRFSLEYLPILTPTASSTPPSGLALQMIDSNDCEHAALSDPALDLEDHRRMSAVRRRR